MIQKNINANVRLTDFKGLAGAATDVAAGICIVFRVGQVQSKSVFECSTTHTHTHWRDVS